jgi:hypothetical protein
MQPRPRCSSPVSPSIRLEIEPPLATGSRLILSSHINLGHLGFEAKPDRRHGQPTPIRAMPLASAIDRQNPFRECSSCDDLAYNDFEDDGTPVYQKSVRFFDLRESAAKGCPSCSMIYAAYIKFQTLSDDHDITLDTSTNPTPLHVAGPNCKLEYHVLPGELDPAYLQRCWLTSANL